MLVTGTVIKGAGRGRLFGYPTANVDYDNDLELDRAVYVGEAVISDRTYACVICFGAREEAGRPWFEAHLFGFSGDLYGSRISVRVGKKVNEIVPLADEEALKEKIAADVRLAKEKLCLPE